MVQVVPLQSCRGYIHTAAHGRPHIRADGYALKEAAAHTKAIIWQELQPVERSHAGSCFLVGTAEGL